jgi:signal transduction histidine kinase
MVSVLQGLDALSSPIFLGVQGFLQPHVRNWLWVFGLILLLSAFYLAGMEAGESRKALLLEHSQLVSEIAERKLMAERLAFVKEAEQQRIRHDLHDTVGQDLAGLLCMAGGLSRKLKDVSEDSSKTAEAIEDGVRHTINDVRKAIQGIAPIEADPKGLEVALVELVDKARAQHEIDVRFECQAPVSVIDYGAATQLYRISQEALTNAVKHAKARRIDLSLLSNLRESVLTITDDGIGIDAEKTLGSGMGLRTMRFRAAAIGATLNISRAADGRGTRIECVLHRQEVDAASSDEGGPNYCEI